MSFHASRFAAGLAALLLAANTSDAADGLLDTTFGGSDGPGRVDLDFARPAGNFDSPRVVVVQRDQKVVIAGPCGAGNGNIDICVARLLPGGVIDTTFSGGRVAVALDLGGDNADLVTDLAVDHAGRILVLANTSAGALFLIRLTATGGLDASWGDAGSGMRALGGSQGGLSGSTQRLAIDDHDRYVVASTYPGGYPTSPSSDLVVARYLDTNAIDTAFAAPAGMLPLGFSDNPDAVRSLAIDSGGNILLGVTVSGPSGSDAGVVRITDAGAIDAGWASAGKRLIDFGTSGHGGDLRRVSALPDRSVVVVTTAGIARLTTAGDLDTQFGSNGTHAVSCSALLGSALTIRAARLADAHRMVIDGLSGTNAAVARVLLDSGDLDAAFDGGCVSVPFVTSSDAATPSSAFGLALQNAHPIVAAEFNYGPTGIDMGVARLTDETLFRDSFDW